MLSGSPRSEKRFSNQNPGKQPQPNIDDMQLTYFVSYVMIHLAFWRKKCLIRRKNLIRGLF